MESTPLPENRRAISWHWIVLGLLVVVHAGAGMSLVPLGNTVDNEAILYLKMGFVLSQPLLFAFWAAFAPQRFYHRILWSSFLCIFVSFIEGSGLFHRTNEVQGNNFVLDLILFVVATLLLSVVRRLTRWQIIHSITEAADSGYRANQYGIKHLLLLTAILAFACGLIRVVYFPNPVLGGFSLLAQITGSTSMILAMLFPIIVIPWLILAYPGKVFAVIPFAITAWAVCDIAAYFIATQMISSFASAQYEELIIFLLLHQLGAALSVLVTTLLMRFCGFRMIRMRKTAALAGEP